MKENEIPGPPSPPKCRHGRISNIHNRCPMCVKEDNEIKKLVHPLIDEWWERKGENISLYHIVFRAYHMGIRKDHETT